MINTNFKKTMPIFDIGEYILREEQEDDVYSFFSYYSKPEVHKYILCNIPKTLDEAKHDFYYWKNSFIRGEGAYFAIAQKIDNKMIGSIGLTGLNTYHKRIEISYDLDSQYWNRGIMTQALRKICDYGFYEFKVNRIEASVVPENSVSRKLLEKNGFEFEGYLRQHRIHYGKFYDVAFYSLLRQDFFS